MGVWYKDGTVSVTNGSTAVTGSGTAFVANVNVGEEFRLKGGQYGYEIEAVVSDTELTLGRIYQETTQVTQDFVIVPVRGVLKAAADAFTAALATMNSHINGALAGIFGGGTLSAPGVRFTSDPDTGMRLVSSNKIALVAGGADKFAVAGNAASGDVVQSDWLDATVGRLLKTGAFGWGETGTANTLTGSTNDITATGLYRYTSSNTDVPTSAGMIMHLNRIPTGASGGMIQVAYGSDGSTQTRVQNGVSPVTFGAWTRMYGQDNILGTVSESAGIPTGNLLEQGSNANGEYVRYADGTQICWRDGFTANYFGADLLRSDWTYPAAFFAAPEFGNIITPASAADFTGASTWDLGAPVRTAGSATIGSFGFWSAADNGFAPGDSVANCSCYAIGRWF